ncbi:hypothetical protein IVA98_05615 [Bradyrhizobium sp. 160]|uniref:hypothetical protein n=1 Tax=unclassified Bradyrhizobium TaxID=2631580 RepID=UPI001FF9DF6B|nr:MULTISPECIES: hypothetical protein [unclassified Bradyrhizobium]MCK1544022.1 hypothetical protein [Bradyrhizobium sp. 179]MCK1622731.1 hypothetical protein [Bradyrhizobium sp. 160]
MAEFSSQRADARPSSALPLLVALLALAVAVGALWMSYGNPASPAVTQDQAVVAPPTDPSIDKIKQDLAALQQAVQEMQANQQKQAGESQQKIAAQQGGQKLLSDQLGSLSARVNALESARAETNAPASQPFPGARAKRTKQ